jgi:hypothetical protein
MSAAAGRLDDEFYKENKTAIDLECEKLRAEIALLHAQRTATFVRSIYATAIAFTVCMVLVLVAANLAGRIGWL